jgi:voltage-gated potassium channel Kch
MTAAALLVVLGAALLMEIGGLSMAMGAFLAGVLLSESHLPPPDRSRHRAVSRRGARPVLPGARVARLIAVCIDDRSAANRIVELARVEFPQAKLMVRSFDREHSLELISAGVDFQIRETFESAMRFGEEALGELGLSETEAAAIAADVRRRDAERVALELTGGLRSGTVLMHKQTPKPTPFTPPKREGQPLNQETATVATGTG